MALACLCQTWSTLGKAHRKLNETGLLFKTPSGYVQQSPFVSIVNVCGDIVVKLAQEFGLTPAARGRLQIRPIAPENTEKSKWDIFFENRK